MFWEVTLTLLDGFSLTCMIFLWTLLLSLPLGLIVALGSMSGVKAISVPIRFLVWVVRGTPLMLQILVLFYAPGLLFGIQGFDRFPTVVLAFTLNYACYFSEIYRSGIQSVPRGQYEGAKVLGLNGRQIFFRVILMQVVRRILPPMGNEVITLVKDTALARVISVPELLQLAFTRYVSKGLIWPLFYTGAFYLLFVGAITLLLRFVEKKIGYYQI